MSRVINPDSAGKERNHLSKSIVLAVRQLARQSDIDAVTRDLSAFIALALLQINATIDVSVLAWEKRGYWVKADKFRMEWTWTGQLGGKLREAVLSEDWPTVASISAQVGQKFSKIKIADHHRLGTPWIGAHKILTE
jgi:hypothetical protein